MDAHLLESAAPDRYRFHDLLRVYAAERAAADLPAARTRRRDRPPAHLVHAHRRRRRHGRLAASATTCRWTSPTTTSPPLSFTSAEDALAWYDSERANLVAATRQAAASGLHEIAWRLPAPLFIVFNSRGNWADCIATHRIALDSARHAGNRQGEAWVLNNLGDALGRHREPEGIGHLEQALAIRREIGDRIGRGAGGQQPRRRLPAARPDGRGARPAAAGPGAEPGGRLPVRRRRCSGQPGRDSAGRQPCRVLQLLFSGL